MEENKSTNRKNNTTLAGQQIVTRFYIAVHEIINRKTIRGGANIYTDVWYRSQSFQNSGG